jgi:hypothetical protein
MSQVTEYFRQAELSLAAYAVLSNGVPNENNLKLAGMSAGQAGQFAKTYTVAAQYNDDYGLSATVFLEADGNRYLAIRGTNDGLDVLTDIVDIALLGSHQ